MAYILTEKTHEFRRQNVPGDGFCLFASVRFVLNVSDAIDNQCLRRQVADRIRLLDRETNPKKIEDCCRRIPKVHEWGGELELRALALLCKVLLCVVSLTKYKNGEVKINILRYGEDQHYKECVYILFDEPKRHYDALYLCRKSDGNNRQTIFERNDVAAQKLLQIFIRDQLGATNYAHLRVDNSDNVDAFDSSRQNHHEDKTMSDLILSELPKRKKSNASKIFTPSRSLPIDDDTEHPSTAHDDRGKQPSVTAIHGNPNQEPMDIEQLLQSDLSAENGYTHAPSMKPIQEKASSILPLSNNTVPNNEEQQQRMSLAVQPIKKFRGRSRHEYKPKKDLKRNKQPSRPRPPSYVADRNNCHYLVLQIPNRSLPADLSHVCAQICMVTPELAGHTFIHPYFKFQVHPTDKEMDDLNPIYVFLNNNELLAPSSNGIRTLRLYLTVIMLTHRELMASQQQLTTFSSSNPNTPIVMKPFDKAADFKKEFHLNDVRFAITLGTKKSHDDVFDPILETRYISEISTQDKHPNK